MADNLIQKKGESTWYVRLAVPKDVQRAFGGRTVLIQSTKTGLRSEAMVRRLPILAEWKAQIEAARRARTARGDEWKQGAQVYATALASRAEESITAIALKRPDPALLAPPSAVAQAILDAQMKDPEYRDALQRLADIRASEGLAGEIALREDLQEIVGGLFQQAIAESNQLSPDEAEELGQIFTTPSSYKPRSPITKSMIAEWATHLKTQVKSAQTQDAHVSRISRLSAFLSAEGLPLTFDTVHQFLDSVSPAAKTRSQYLWSGRTFWKWANKYAPSFREQFSNSPCPFDGHELPRQGKEAGESWIPFSRAEVEQLHAQAVSKGDTALANLIAIAAYTGARLNEIARIRPEDAITAEDGSPVGFKINEAKTEAGIREVPLHPAIAPLFAQLMAQAPTHDGYLFKGSDTKHGRRLEVLGKRFGRLKSESFSELHCFHSIRKTTVTELHRAGVTLEVLPWIIGHESAKAFTLDVYSAGPSFEQKRECINRLEFSFAHLPEN